MLRTMVRLAFHDCASTKCDGCVDTADARNNPGLAEMIQTVQPLCTKYGLSKADCWATAGSIAVEEASYNGADLTRVPLFFGRTDAAQCSGFTQRNPEASFPAAAAGARPTNSRHRFCPHPPTALPSGEAAAEMYLRALVATLHCPLCVALFQAAGSATASGGGPWYDVPAGMTPRTGAQFDACRRPLRACSPCVYLRRPSGNLVHCGTARWMQAWSPRCHTLTARLTSQSAKQ